MVSVIIPCRNEGKHIEACLRSILNQEPCDEVVEILVADGMSDDGTRAILERISKDNDRVRMIDNRDGIVSTGLNAAIRAARGNIIIRIDAHTEYEKDYLRLCVETLRKTGADNVGGPWIARGRDYVSRAVAAAFQSRFAVGNARGHDPHHEGVVDTVYLGCWRKELFTQIGMFDEDLVRNQDDEFNLRLSRAGGKVWQNPSIRSTYYPRNSLAALFKQYMQYGYWKVKVIRKHGMPASVRHLVPATFALTLSALLLLGFFWLPALGIWLALVSLYAGCVALATIAVARQAGWTLLPILPPVFACYHFGYGLGFLAGIWDFSILKSKPRKFFSRLTRAPHGETC